MVYNHYFIFLNTLRKINADSSAVAGCLFSSLMDTPLRCSFIYGDKMKSYVKLIRTLEIAKNIEFNLTLLKMIENGAHIAELNSAIMKRVLDLREELREK
jgi:hypothetical protein